MTNEASGERNRCPHCGVIADVEPAARLRFRCRVCGAPRVPLDDDSVERSGRERKALKQAQRLRFRHAAWWVTAAALGGLGLLSLLVTVGVLLAVTPGIVAAVVALVAAAAPLLLALHAARRTRTISTELEGKIAEAWRVVAEDLVARDGDDVTVAQLSRALRIEEDEAERLLTDLSVHDVVKARVTDSGDLVFHRSDAPPRLRVQSPPEPLDLEPADSDPDSASARRSAEVTDSEG